MPEEEYKAPAWTAQMQGENKTDEFFGGYETITDAGNALKTFSTENGELKEQVKTLEGRSFIPGEDASDEDRAAFYKATGKPDSADNYKSLDRTVLNGVLLSEERKEALRQAAFEGNYSQAQYESMEKAAAANEAVNATAVESANAEAVKTLKTDWPGEEYEKNTKLLGRGLAGLEKMGIEGLDTIFKDQSMGNNVALIKAFAMIGSFFEDDQFLDGKTRGKTKKYDGSLNYDSM